MFEILEIDQPYILDRATVLQCGAQIVAGRVTRIGPFEPFYSLNWLFQDFLAIFQSCHPDLSTSMLMTL